MGIHEFSWSDTFILDWEKGKEFYSELFNWNFVDQYHEGQLVYTLACHDLDANPPESTSIVGMASLEGCDFEGPCHWMAYLLVENVDETIEKFKSANGTVYKGPMDVMDAGRMAVCGDAQGKMIMLWQQLGHSGSQIKGVHGTLCWFELITSEVAAAIDFYCSVFDWTVEKETISTGDIWLCKYQKSIIGGIHDRLEEAGNHELWLPYFRVDNINDSLKIIDRWKGSMVAGIFEEPAIGKYAVAADFEGNMFGLTEFA